MSFFRRSKGDVRPEDQDPNRDALFGNRRAAGHPPSTNNNGYRSNSSAITNPYVPERGGHSGNGYGGPQSGYGRDNSEIGGRDGYGGANPYDYSRRQYANEPSAESNCDEEADKIKLQIKDGNRKAADSLENALRAATLAEESGRTTFERLGRQGQRLYKAEHNLNEAEIRGRAAGKQTRQLERENGSMFVPRFGGSSSARAKEDADALASHRSDREEREKTREFDYESRKRAGKALNDTGRVESGATTSSAETPKCQFEADESDDERENVIANNLDQLGAIAGRLKGLAMATSVEVDHQNVQIERIMKKSDRVDDQIAATHNKLRKIH